MDWYLMRTKVSHCTLSAKFGPKMHTMDVILRTSLQHKTADSACESFNLSCSCNARRARGVYSTRKGPRPPMVLI